MMESVMMRKPLKLTDKQWETICSTAEWLGIRPNQSEMVREQIDVALESYLRHKDEREYIDGLLVEMFGWKAVEKAKRNNSALYDELLSCHARKINGGTVNPYKSQLCALIDDLHEIISTATGKHLIGESKKAVTFVEEVVKIVIPKIERKTVTHGMRLVAEQVAVLALYNPEANLNVATAHLEK
jgi:hypothetical protein